MMKKWTSIEESHSFGDELIYTSPGKRKKIRLTFSEFNVGRSGKYSVIWSKNNKEMGVRSFRTKRETERFAKRKMRDRW